MFGRILISRYLHYITHQLMTRLGSTVDGKEDKTHHGRIATAKEYSTLTVRCKATKYYYDRLSRPFSTLKVGDVSKQYLETSHHNRSWSRLHIQSGEECTRRHTEWPTRKFYSSRCNSTREFCPNCTWDDSDTESINKVSVKAIMICWDSHLLVLTPTKGRMKQLMCLMLLLFFCNTHLYFMLLCNNV